MNAAKIIKISERQLRELILTEIDSAGRNNTTHRSRRAKEFFEGNKYGKAILVVLNGKRFSREKVESYLENLGSTDIKWTRLMDFISSNLGLNHREYSNYNDQLKAMINKIEKLYTEYVSNLKKLPQ